MTFAPALSSGGVVGKPILVAATSSPGTVLHQATDAIENTGLDEIWIWATNNHTDTVVLTLQFGGTETKDLTEYTLGSKQGAALIIPGWRLNTETSVKAFAAVANVVSCQVNVIRYLRQ